MVNHQIVASTTGVGANKIDTNDLAPKIDVTLLTGGIDRHYAFGLSVALASKGVQLDVIGNMEMNGPEMHSVSTLNFINLHGNSRQTLSLGRRIFRHVAFYGRLIPYARISSSRIFHILWNYRFQLLDRTLLMLYYKALGKKIVLTAHNVNAAERDGRESILNHMSLRVQYQLVDHIFVHTDRMKKEVVDDFGIASKKVSIIPFGINNCVPNTELNPTDAKRRMGINNSDKTILFFGRILPYKGLEYLVEAFQQIVHKNNCYRLIIAGEPKKESARYWRDIQKTIERKCLDERVIQIIRFIADEDVEVYYKAADVLVLPYTHIFQSGVLFMAYSYGLPAIATDVGSLRDNIVEGETGYICRPRDAPDLARAIETYFESTLFSTLDQRRAEIMAFARERNSWEAVSVETCRVYAQLLAQKTID